MKKIFSLVLVAALIFSISIVAFAETPTFSKAFGSYDDMLAYLEKYAVDYPNVEYVNGGELTIPIKGFELKNKELLFISSDNSDYTMTDLSCGESWYEYGINYTHCKFVKNDDTTIDIMAYYQYDADDVMYDVEYFAGMEAWSHEFCCPDGEVFVGEVAGYYYEAFYYTSHNRTSCRIAADDVMIIINFNTAFDEDFIESLVIEKSGVSMPVLEVSPSAPILVTDELLEAVKKDYSDNRITKDDITVSDYFVFDDYKKIVRLTVSDYYYTCDEVVLRIGDYILYVPQRPLPQILVDGVLYDIDDAYESGIISDDDLHTISGFNSNNYSLTKYEEIYGDIDGDKRVSVIDAVYVQRYLCGYRDAEADYTFADFDRDGEITILDATAIQMAIAGL